MKTKNLTPFLFAAKVTSRAPPRPEMTLIVRGVFRLRPGEPVAPLDGLIAQGHMTAEVFADGDDERRGEPVYPGDFADWKPRADLLARGTCFPPGGGAVESSVRFSVGRWSKTLRVVGPRAWSDDLPAAVMSRPLSFARMPISYANAFGGPGMPLNPVGKGHETDALPNVELPDAPIRRRLDVVPPAGLGPLNPAWPQRAGKVGKEYGASYRAKRAPYYAEDFDWTYFNAAPADQQLPGYLRGDEDLAFHNLHPAASLFSARLPGLRIRAFVKDARASFREVTMCLDTLFADLDDEKLFLTWRGLDPVAEADLADVKTVLVASEAMSAPPLPVEHYQGKLEAFEGDPLGLEDRLTPEMHALVVQMRADTTKGVAPGTLSPELLEKLGPLMGPGPGISEAIAGVTRSAPPGIDVSALLAKAANDAAPPPFAPPAPGGTPALPLGDIVRSIRREVAKLKKIAAAEGQDVEGLNELEAAANDPQLAALDPSLGAEGAAADPDEEPGPGKNLTGRDLSKQDLHGRDLSHADLTGANLSGANLRDARLVRATLKHAILFETDLAGADLGGADLTRANLTGARAPDVDLRGAILDGASFHKANLDAANLDGAGGELVVFKKADLTRSSFKKAELRASIFEGAILERATLEGATLVRCLFLQVTATEASFAGATLTRSSFADGDLTRASFVEAKADDTRWMRATISGADFTYATLARAHFSEARGALARFSCADLTRARFYRASLERADLGQANLFRADLCRAQLTGARFTGASLYDAKLVEATVEDCDFAGADLTRSTLEGA